jgi:phosphoglycolate phosphatase-like HAD superfamily hydrolase
MLVKVIILDFDGVVVESNNIKHRAFSEIFKAYPAHYEEIMAYHFAHNAVNRHAKFKYIMKNILKEDYDEEQAGVWAAKFSDLTRNQIINCPYVEGALEFILYFYDKLPLYIASATPEDELEIILKKRGLEKYFKGRFGAPTPKVKMFSKIVANEEVKPADLLFIGDSPEDCAAADEFGCGFVARSSGSVMAKTGAKAFKNMLEIKKYILTCQGKSVVD